MTLDQTIKDLSDKVLAGNEHIKEITFYTIDGAIIPGCEILRCVNHLPFVLNINKKYSYSLNLNKNYSIVHDSEDNNRESEEAYLAYCQGIGLPKYSSLLLANFTNKLNHTITAGDNIKK